MRIRFHVRPYSVDRRTDELHEAYARILVARQELHDAKVREEFRRRVAAREFERKMRASLGIPQDGPFEIPASMKRQAS